MTVKTNYIEFDLEWLEQQVEDIKKDCDATPIDQIYDRTVGKKVITKEEQKKARREALFDYTKLVEAISKLRERDEIKKKSVRGNQTLSPLEDKKIHN